MTPGGYGARRGPGAGPVLLMVPAVLLFLGFAVVLLVFSVPEFGYRGGLAGTAGTVSQVNCHDVGSGSHPKQVCDALFEPGGLRVALDGGADLGTATAPARLHTDRVTASAETGSGVAQAVAGLLFAIAFLTIAVSLPAVLLRAARLRRRGRPTALSRRSRLLLLWTPVVLAAIGALIGLATL